MGSCKHSILFMEKGKIKSMIIKIFKISTMEMWTIYKKDSLIKLIEQETSVYLSKKFTIDQIIKYLPIDDYCIIK